SVNLAARFGERAVGALAQPVNRAIGADWTRRASRELVAGRREVTYIGAGVTVAAERAIVPANATVPRPLVGCEGHTDVEVEIDQGRRIGTHLIGGRARLRVGVADRFV